MKKIFSIALVACIAISALAVNTPAKLINNRPVKAVRDYGMKTQKTMDFRIADFTAAYKNGAIPAAPKAHKATADEAVAVDTAFYFINPDGGLYGGVYTNSYFAYPTIMQRANADVEFWNESMFNEGGDFGWFFGDISEETYLSNDTDMVVPAGFFKPGYGAETTPLLAMESGAQYYYGETEDKQYWYSFDPDIYSPLTKCHMYTSSAFDADGYDFACWGLTSGDDYIYGTGVDMTPYAAYGYKCGAVDTFGTVFGFEGCTTKIDTITLMVASKQSSSIQLGSQLKVNLYPVQTVGNNHYVDLDNELASYRFTSKDVAGEYYYQQANITMGALNAPIKKEISGQFFITVSGFNGKGTNIGLYADGSDPYGFGDTYYISNGGTFYNYWGCNALISVNAAIVEPELPTAIDNVSDNAVKTVKEFRNGQLIIKRDNKVFNVLGAQL